jgi:hypothetical protein
MASVPIFKRFKDEDFEVFLKITNVGASILKAEQFICRSPLFLTFGRKSS